VELPIKFDLSNLSGVGVAQVLFPFLPGGILVIGASVIRADLAGRFFGIGYLGYFAKVGIALFVAYICGLFLAFSVLGVVGGVAGAIASLIGTSFQLSWKPWQSTIWRQTAKRFIGEKFTPVVDLPMDADIVKIQIETAKAKAAAQGGVGLQEAFSVLNQQSEKTIADIVWAQWFSAFESYFAFPLPRANMGTMMSQAAHCSAWAVVILMYFGPYHSWAVWLICWLVVLGAFIEYLLNNLNPHMVRSNADRQIGAMLRILVNRPHDSEKGDPERQRT